jgi:hypothetical protein
MPCVLASETLGNWLCVAMLLWGRGLQVVPFLMRCDVCTCIRGRPCLRVEGLKHVSLCSTVPICPLCVLLEELSLYCDPKPVDGSLGMVVSHYL